MRSRPVSGIFYPPRIGSSATSATRGVSRPLTAQRVSVASSEDTGYDHPTDRGGGFLNEAEDEIDERSALLSARMTTLGGGGGCRRKRGEITAVVTAAAARR